MFSPLTLLTTGLAVGAILLSWSRCGVSHSVSVFNFAYLGILLPKALIVDARVFGGAEVPTTFSTPTDQFFAAFQFIGLFIAVLNLAFIGGYGRGPRAETRPICVGPKRFARTFWVVSIPVFVVAFVVVVRETGVSWATLSAKRDLIDRFGNYSLLPYVAARSLDLIRAPLYFAFAAVVLEHSESRLTRRVLVVSGVLTIFTSFVLSQRSTLVILALDLIVLYGAIRVTTWIRLGAFAGVFNLAVLYFRTAGGALSQLVSAIYFRLFLFDPEKVGKIAAFSSREFAMDPSVALLLTSTDGVALASAQTLHYAIGTEIFGLSSGVPPSIIGEVILAIGGAFVLPVALALGVLLGTLNALTRRTQSLLVGLVTAILANRVAYFAANSDLRGMVERCAFDLAILAVGFVLFTEPGRSLLGGRRRRPDRRVGVKAVPMATSRAL